MDQTYALLVAQRLIEQLEQGTAPWVKPWRPGERFMPYNPVTGRNYHAMNGIWLMAAAEANGHQDSRWLTAQQAQSLGCSVRPGENGTMIQFWKWRDSRPVVDDTGTAVRDDNGTPIVVTAEFERPQVLSAVVFNATQLSGLAPAPDRSVLPERERYEVAEAIIADAGVPLLHMPSTWSGYDPLKDEIRLPERERFATADEYYRVALHEMGHATGHRTRLNRDMKDPFGSIGYAREELRGGIASLLLGEQLGIGHSAGNHAAYSRHWITILKEYPQELFRAAAAAEKIVNYLRRPPRRQNDEVKETLVTSSDGGEGREEGARGAPVFITVPYAEKDQAKALGARWDNEARSWFVPEVARLADFSRWPRKIQGVGDRIDPGEEFGEALRAAGLVVPALPIMDGKLHRVPVEDDKRGARSGAYVGYLDGRPAGFIQNYKSGHKQNWTSSQHTEVLTAQMREALHKAAAEKLLAREEGIAAVHRQTVALLTRQLEHAGAAPVGHPYLVRKGIQPHGARLNETGPLAILGGEAEPQKWSAVGDLLIPIHSVDGEKLLSVQSVGADGRKSFPRGGLISGGVHQFGRPEDIGSNGIVIAEGFSTAAKIHQLTGLPVAAAFTSTNLLAAAMAFRKEWPEAPIYIAGDNDHQKELERDAAGRPKPNTGRIAAEQAAEAVDGISILPRFAAGDDSTDWNDYAATQGKDSFLLEWKVACRTGEQRKAMRTETPSANAARNADLVQRLSDSHKDPAQFGPVFAQLAGDRSVSAADLAAIASAFAYETPASTPRSESLRRIELAHDNNATKAGKLRVMGGRSAS